MTAGASMEQRETIIRLCETDSLITEGEKDVYRVQSGRVIVYILPLRAGKPDSRLRLCEVEAGQLIPSLRYTDENYVEWCFVLKPQNEAELLLLGGKATNPLREKFAEKAGLESFEQEGFAKSVIEFYKRNSLKDHVFLGMQNRQLSDVNIANYGVIRKAFQAGEEWISGNDPLYRTVVFACRKTGIRLPAEDRIRALCHGELSVPEIARASRFLCRSVVLEEGWYGRDSGTIIGSLDGKPVACIPRGQESYTIYYGGEKDGRQEKLRKETAERIDPRAWVIGRRLSSGVLGKKELISFGIRSIRRSDLLWVAALGLLGALIGILLPTLNQKIYDEYIPLGDIGQLAQFCSVIASFMLGSMFFDMVKKLCEYRIGSHIGYDLQNAVYSRVFRLPESFFRSFESADLAQRLGNMFTVGNTYVTSTLLTGMGTVFSLFYLLRMFKYAKKLSWWALGMLLLYALVQFFISRRTLRFDRKIEEQKGRASGRLYQFLNGIEKIRMAGVEDRAAHEYLLPYAEKQTLAIDRNHFAAWAQILSGTVGTLFSMAFYLIVVKGKVEITSGAFMAFNSAFGAFSSAIFAMIDGLLQLYCLKPVYERLTPVLEIAEEDEEEKASVERLRGEISVSNVSFAYEKNGADVLRGIDLHIAPGEYIGIVGASGCGKSTLLKLLLGFEEPDDGQICYDGKNLRQLDKRELRKNLGVVLQNGKLIAGSIYENITITAPQATMQDVSAVIDAVGLKEDIARMPMGVHTVLSESSGTISGGQQQRILIARAIISHPSILIFDEATSALDNMTQAAVCESLERMNVTRIVVAHRLSTIKGCDRIVVMDAGRIVEEGNYQSLMERGGLFCQLASRQLL